MANLWHPLRGVQISNLGDKRLLFHFFYKMDIDRVLNGDPWTFNNHLLAYHFLEDGEDPMKVPLIYTTFKVQVHDLPPGFFIESIPKKLGNFKGKFFGSMAKVWGLWKDGRKESRMPIYPVLGLNLKGDLKLLSGMQWDSSKLQDHSHMDHDSEECTIEAIRRLRHMLKVYNPQVVFFMETKISNVQMENVDR
ncbi:hypothetical protein Goklo_025143, partial [Gossypium klotzschianum]|nr:hypothetical protein [Gossypium klotzschianum]